VGSLRLGRNWIKKKSHKSKKKKKKEEIIAAEIRGRGGQNR